MFIFNSWFASKRSAESATDVGADIIDMVKTNTKVFCKDTMNKLTNYWPGGSYLLLKRNSTVPGYRGLLAVGYKYNYRKFLYFVTTELAGITKAAIPYLSNYPDQVSNVYI